MDNAALIELLKLKAYLLSEYTNKRLVVHTKDILDMINKVLNNETK